MLKLKVTFLNLEKIVTINNSELVNGINSLDFDQRFEIASGINLESNPSKQMEILARFTNKLTNQELDKIQISMLKMFLENKLKAIGKIYPNNQMITETFEYNK